MKQFGIATICGIPGKVYYSGTGTIYGDLIFNSANFMDSFTKVELLNAEGNLVGVKTSNRKLSLNLLFTPFGNNTTQAASVIAKIAPMARVILSNWVPNLFNGVYNYVGPMSVSQTSNGRAAVILPIEMVVDNIYNSNRLSNITMIKY